MSPLKLRDRDAVISEEGLIFRVFGYSHPGNAYICDVEYAPSSIFRSENPKAFRNRGQNVFFKFYEDEGLRFLKANFPQYLIRHDMLGCKVVGVDGSDVVRVEKPGERLRELMTNHPSDKLVAASNSAIELMLQCSSLSLEDFGVFGSLLHGFHHPNFSDLDFVVYGRDRIRELCQTLQEMYADIDGVFENEFRNDDAVRDKHWRFLNLSSKEYVWHQRRKLIYALFNDTGTSRIVKTEFEPVKDWKEIVNEYNGDSRICQKGWVKMLARVTDDGEATFIPSVYGIEPLDVMEGAQSANDAVRVVSFVEEFRMQVRVDETILIEGNLEEVVTPRGSSYQVALTYCPRYYEQVLKVANFSH